MMNQLKTIMLLGLLSALLLWVGEFFGGTTGLVVAAVFVGLLNFGMYWFSDKIVLKMYRAKEVDHSSKLYIMVKEMASRAKLPMPQVYVIPSDNPNAFATGRNPKNAAVACTKGIMDLLDENELKAVIAHELGHIRNRDTLITTVAATIAGIIGYLGTMARWSALFGGYRRRDNGNILELLVLAIVTPLAATIIQLAISRQREYMADASGAEISRNPHALADALLKIDKGAKAHPMRMGSTATASLFIANPFQRSTLVNLLSTHPPIEERVERLRKMKHR